MRGPRHRSTRLAKNSAGEFVDKNFNVIKEPTYGHKPGFENRRIVAAGERLGLNQEQLNQFVNAQSDYFFIEEKAVNLSHVEEIPGDGNLGEILDDMEAFFGLPEVIMSIVSPLYRAIIDGDCERIDALLAGRDPNLRTEDTDKWNLLHLALVSVSRAPRPEVVRHLIESWRGR